MKRVLWFAVVLIAMSAGALAETDEECSGLFTVDNRGGSLTSTYVGVFCKDVEVINTIKCSPDWAGHTPAKVVFDLNGDTNEVATSANEAKTTYNMGADLVYSRTGAVNELKAHGVAADGYVTESQSLNFWGLELPEWAISYESKKGPINWELNPLTGRLRFFGDVEVLKGGVKGTVNIPKSIPEIGGTWGVEIDPLNFTWELAAQPRFGDASGITGSCELGGKWSAEAACGTKRKGDISASISGAFDFYPQFKLTDVSAELAGSLKFLFPRVPLLCQWSGCCHTGYCPYFQASITPEVTGTVGMEEGEPDVIAGLKWKAAELNIGVTLAGTIGAGSEGSIYYIAGTIGGKPYLILQFPGNPSSACLNQYVKEAGFDLKASVQFESAWWKKEWDQTYHIFKCPETSGAPAPATLAEEPRVVPVEREYLKADGGYCVFPARGGVQSVGGLPGPIQNVGTGPMPSVAANSDDGLLLFVYDDAGKPTGKHQEIYFANWTGSAWSTHSRITDNLNPDLFPAAAIDSAGKKIAVWVRAPEPSGAETGPRDILPGCEIVWSLYDDVGETWSAQQALTNNAYVDTLPWFERSSSGDLRACWVASGTNAIPVWHDEEIAPSLDAMAADWNGSAFGAPYLIRSGLQSVSPPSVARTGTHEFIAYLVDTDNNSGTAQDREVVVCARELGQPWGPDQQLTSDGISDTAAQVTADAAGTPMVVWTKRLVPVSVPDDDDTSVDQLWFSTWNGSAWSAPAMAFEAGGILEPRLIRTAGGRIALFWIASSEQFSDLFYSVYDSDQGAWGAPQQVTHDQGAETMVSLAETGGNILAAYAKRRIDLTDPSGLPLIGLSDLYLLEHVPVKDLAIAPEDISFDPTPVRGESSTISADVHCTGDFTVEDVLVEFYDGDPDAGGTLIGQDTVELILAGGTAQAQVSWLVPNDTAQHRVFVLVDPAGSIPESDDIGNNKAAVDVFGIDLAPSAPMMLGSPGAEQVLVGASVRNAGSAQSPSTRCEIRRDSPEGDLVYSTELAALSAGEMAHVQFLWDVSAVPSGEHTLVVVADASDVAQETNESNNAIAGQVVALPDLHVLQWSAHVASGNAELRVTNIGSKSCPATSARANCGDQILGEAAVPAIVAGSEVVVSVPIAPGAQYDSITVTVNPGPGGVAEASYLNNSAVIAESTASTVGRARLLADGTKIALADKIVTAAFGDCFYIEEPDRSGGVKVIWATPPAVGLGANVSGKIGTQGAERVLFADSVTTGGAAQVAPIGIVQRSFGGHLGGPVRLGFDDPAGLSSVYNLGLLARIWGHVTYVDPAGAFAYVDDGSALNDGNTLGDGGSAVGGVKVILPAGALMPPVGIVVTLTGVASSETIGGVSRRALRVRSQEDICIASGAVIAGRITQVGNQTIHETVESPHPYPNYHYNTWTITGPAGTAAVRVHFTQIELESGYDYLYVQNAAGATQQMYNGMYSDVWTDWVSGDTIKLNLTSDGSVTYYGFQVDRYEVEVANTPVPGVTVTLGPGGLSTLTGGDGKYSFSGLEAGAYTVTPYLAGVTFTPECRTVELPGGGYAPGNDFVKN